MRNNHQQGVVDYKKIFSFNSKWNEIFAIPIFYNCSTTPESISMREKIRKLKKWNEAK